MKEKTLQDFIDELNEAVDSLIKDMESMRNTLEFEIPEGYEIDQEKSKGRKVVYKKVEKYEPKPHDIVVFDGISMRRYITLYTAPDELYAPAVQYDLFEFNPKGEIYPLPVPLIGVKPASDFEKDLYKRTLEENGYEYDPEKKEVRKKRWRAEVGQRYWFIDENMRVRTIMDYRIGTDDSLYKSGNYFRTHEEAEEVAAEFRKILEKHK